MSIESITVIASGFLYFCLGGIWYGILGKSWIQAWGLNEKEINQKDPIPYLIAFIGSIWTAYGLFILIKHVEPKNLSEALTIGVGTWLFLVVGSTAKHYAFARVSLKAFFIDYLLDLIGITILSIVIWQAVI